MRAARPPPHFVEGGRTTTTPAAPSVRSHLVWALATELAFFVFVLVVATAVAMNAPALLHAGLAAYLRRLDRTFVPLAHLHPWYRLALGIFAHNLEPLAGFAVAGALAAFWPARVRGTAATLFLVLVLAIDAFFWLSNIGAGGVVVGVVAYQHGLAPARVWLSLVPHGLFEIFALAWVLMLPVRFASLWLGTGDPSRAFAQIEPAIWPGTLVAACVLAVAAGIEATLSVALLHALVPSVHTLVNSAV